MQEITIFSDYICPFCFIGHHRVQELAAEVTVRTVWEPFEIHPEVPAEGVPLSRFPSELLSRLEESVGALAAEIGLEFRMPRKLPNSRLALIGGEITKKAGVFEHYHAQVFRAYFQLDQDIGNPDVLAQIAQTADVDADFFLKSLNEEIYFDMLRAARRKANSLGLSAVPSFVFADGAIIVGAQPYKVLKEKADKVEKASS